MTKKINILSFVFLIAFALFLVFASACTNASNVKQNTNLCVTDLCNREICFDKPVERIIAMAPSDCETLAYLGAENLIIGRGSDCNYPESILNITDYGDASNVNIESFVASNCDVVIIPKLAYSFDFVKALEHAGVKVVVNEVNNIQDCYKYFRLLGQISSHEQEAEELVAKLQNKIATYNMQNSRQDNRIYLQISSYSDEFWTTGKNTFIDDVFTSLNLNNIFNDCNLWFQVSKEQIIQRNPDIILIAKSNNTDTKFMDQLKYSDVWQNISAVQNDKIFLIDADIVLRPSPRLIDAMDEIYKLVYE